MHFSSDFSTFCIKNVSFLLSVLQPSGLNALFMVHPSMSLFFCVLVVFVERTVLLDFLRSIEISGSSSEGIDGA